MGIILASSSPRRRELMALITRDYTVRSSDVDERAIRAETPALLAQKLAVAKCRAVAESFLGVAHRLEMIRTLHGVTYCNDSIASSPTRTIAGLHSFRQKLVLIAGGYDKKIPFDALGPEICAHVRLLILCGATAEKIEAAVKSAPDYRPGQPEILHAQTLEEAVRLAKRHTVPGDIVTLSPACAAFDQFKNFMVRGETYKTLVRAL